MFFLSITKVSRLLLVLLLCMASPLMASPREGEKIIVIGAWERAQPALDRAALELGVKARFVGANEIDTLEIAELTASDTALILILDVKGAVKLKKTLAEARQVKPSLKVLALDYRDSQKDIEQAGLLERDEIIKQYWRHNGLENLRRLLVYVQVKHLGKEGKVLPPVVVPDFGIYHPKAVELFADVESFLRWSRSTGRFVDGAPRVALIVKQSFIVTGDTKVLEAVLSAFERRGINIVGLFASDHARLDALLKAWKPDLLVDDGHGSPAVLKGATDLDVPQMKAISMHRATIAEWEASPLGLTYQDVNLHLLTQEVYGIIEPVVVGGLTVNIAGYRIHEPIPDRVEKLTERALKWLALRRKKNAEKKVAIIYFNKDLGQADLGRGSPSGAFLDGPESMVRLLRAMKERGYTISRLPKDGAELIEWMKREGRNVGAWTHKDLAKLVETGAPVLLPQRAYEKWFEKLSDANRKAVTEKFGPPPGDQMVWLENEKKFIVLPKIDLGNVILMPQPARGPENDEKLLHSRDIPPPHQYLAFYRWLEEEFKADAVIHFGTHGSELLLPVKASGLSKDDFGDISLGTMPNINPWIIDNVAEGMLAKRRAYAVLIDHLTPPIEEAGLSGDLKNLHDDMDKFASLEPGLLKEEFRKSVSEAARKAEFSKKEALLTDKEIAGVAEKVHEIHNQIAPMKLHVLGEVPEERHLIPFLVSMLGSRFLDELGAVLPVPKTEDRFGGDRRKWLRARAEEIVGSMVRSGLSADEALKRAGAGGGPAKTLALVNEYRDRFAKTPNEIEYTLRALEGRFVPPGSGNDPVRNPSAIPTGRNMYAVNPEQIPTKPAWEVAVALVDKLLKTRKVKKIAFDLNAFETMRDFGVMEAQILYLMGVRPVWDANNLAVDIEVIPREKLGRPRIDAFISISGTMRDNFPSRIQLLDKAARMVSTLDEPDNYVREGTRAREKALLKRNFSAERAGQFAAARIFGQKPGEYGTKILYLVPKSGSWDKEKEIADIYMENMSYVFTGNAWGEKVEGLYEEAVQGSEMILRTWASNMMSPLSNHHVIEYTGGLNMAVKAITGKDPEIALNDVRDEPRLRNFEDALRVELHATLLNAKWTKGMMENGYAGAGMMAELVKNTFGWKVTRSGSVSDATWNEIHAVYVKDKHSLKLREWMDRMNPHAFQEIAATLLEAHRKGYWSADAATIADLARQYAESVVKYRESGGLVGGGNVRLQKKVSEALQAPGDKPLVEGYKAEVASAKGQPATARVAGQKLETPKEAAPVNESLPQIWPVALAAVFLVLVALGFWKRMGVRS